MGSKHEDSFGVLILLQSGLVLLFGGPTKFFQDPSGAPQWMAVCHRDPLPLPLAAPSMDTLSHPIGGLVCHWGLGCNTVELELGRRNPFPHP